jgi:radical SAM protein with 4Fe4S-binding SPASM domain
VHFDNYFEWPNLKNRVYPDSKCLGLNSQIAILSDGRVTPCCLDSNAEINLGNIKESSLENILKKSDKIAKGLKYGKPTEELCKRCSYRLRFAE